MTVKCDGIYRRCTWHSPLYAALETMINSWQTKHERIIVNIFKSKAASTYSYLKASNFSFKCTIHMRATTMRSHIGGTGLGGGGRTEFCIHLDDGQLHITAMYVPTRYYKAQNQWLLGAVAYMLKQQSAAHQEVSAGNSMSRLANPLVQRSDLVPNINHSCIDYSQFDQCWSPQSQTDQWHRQIWILVIFSDEQIQT